MAVSRRIRSFPIVGACLQANRVPRKRTALWIACKQAPTFRATRFVQAVIAQPRTRVCLQNVLSSRGPQRRAVAIQMDCFVVPLGGTSRNDILQTHPSWNSQPEAPKLGSSRAG